MRIEQFTLKAQEALQAARPSPAAGITRGRARAPRPALLAQQQGIAEALLRHIGTDPALVQRRVDEALDASPAVQGGEGAR